MTFRIADTQATQAQQLVLSPAAQAQADAAKTRSEGIAGLRQMLDKFAEVHATLLAAGPQTNRCRLFSNCRWYAQQAVEQSKCVADEEICDRAREDLAKVQVFLEAGTSALDYLERVRRPAAPSPLVTVPRPPLRRPFRGVPNSQ